MPLFTAKEARCCSTCTHWEREPGQWFGYCRHEDAFPSFTRRDGRVVQALSCGEYAAPCRSYEPTPEAAFETP